MPTDLDKPNTQSEVEVAQVSSSVLTAPSGLVKKPRGFAAIDPDVRSAIASKGGKAAHIAGRAHKFTSEEARAAGRKGGNARHARRGADGGASELPTLPAPPESGET